MQGIRNVRTRRKGPGPRAAWVTDSAGPAGLPVHGVGIEWPVVSLACRRGHVKALGAAAPAAACALSWKSNLAPASDCRRSGSGPSEAGYDRQAATFADSVW
jgi:hypothetical protein